MPLFATILVMLCLALLAAAGVLLWRQRRRIAHYENLLRDARRHDAIGTLAGGIAHDFNNILGSILGFGALLEEDLITSPEQQGMARQIMTAARRGQDIVAQLMRYSRRANDDSARLGAVPVSLDRLVRDHLSLLQPCLRASTQVSFDNRAANDMVEADPVQLGQVLVNLALNADHAIGTRTGHIRITLGDAPPAAAMPVRHAAGPLPPAPFLCLSVEDDGCGMDEKTAARIFDPFFTTKPVGEGTGLGLAAADGIIRRHGGAIVVHSTPFKGTRFDILLPQGKA